MLDADTDQARAISFACHGSNSPTEIGEGDQGPEESGESEGAKKSYDLRQRDEGKTQIDHLKGIRSVDRPCG